MEQFVKGFEMSENNMEIGVISLFCELIWCMSLIQKFLDRTLSWLEEPK